MRDGGRACYGKLLQIDKPTKNGSTLDGTGYQEIPPQDHISTA